MKSIRLYSDAAGESHFEQVDLKLTLREFAPPAAPLHISEPQAAKAFLVLQLPVGWAGEMHVFAEATGHVSPVRLHQDHVER